MKSRIITSLLFTAAQIGLAKDIVQRDLSTGKIVGGEHFTIVQQPRKAIWPEIKSTLTQEGYELEAVNVDEDATYTWLNDQGAVLAEGKSYKSGIYLVSLLVKGSVIDSRNVVCQQ